jgi:hypothetical protein
MTVLQCKDGLPLSNRSLTKNLGSKVRVKEIFYGGGGGGAGGGQNLLGNFSSDLRKSQEVSKFFQKCHF